MSIIFIRGRKVALLTREMQKSATISMIFAALVEKLEVLQALHAVVARLINAAINSMSSILICPDFRIPSFCRTNSLDPPTLFPIKDIPSPFQRPKPLLPQAIPGVVSWRFHGIVEVVRIAPGI